jgi:hypothetical protein
MNVSRNVRRCGAKTSIFWASRRVIVKAVDGKTLCVGPPDS